MYELFIVRRPEASGGAAMQELKDGAFNGFTFEL